MRVLFGGLESRTGWGWSYPWVALILHVGKPLIKFAALSDIVILR